MGFVQIALPESSEIFFFVTKWIVSTSKRVVGWGFSLEYTGGAYDSPDPVVGWEEGTPSPPFLCLPRTPPRFPPHLGLMPFSLQY